MAEVSKFKFECKKCNFNTDCGWKYNRHLKTTKHSDPSQVLADSTVKGYIYKVYSTMTNQLYVGSTVDSVNKRFKDHKKHYRAWKLGKRIKVSLYDLFETYGVDNFKIDVLEECEVGSRAELFQKEQEWINKLKPTNTLNAFTDGKAYKHAYWSGYYKENKDRILNHKRLHRQNEDVIRREREATKQWRLDNVDKYTCNPCNYKTDDKSKYARHLSTAKHLKRLG
jgi:group I intron endonuclease